MTQASLSLSAEHPFPGLRPFSRLDHEYFFGRGDQVFALYRLIDRSRFVAVVGGSGSGKSSLVRAGLLPLLDSETGPRGAVKWRVAEMRPGDAPLGRLTDALANLACDEDDGLRSVRRERITFALHDSTNGIEEALDEIDTLGGTSVLLVVDQFEELFRYGDGRGQNPREEARQRDEAIHFVQLLLQARSIPERDVHVVLTMRSDFIGDCARFQGLPEAVSATQFLVPSLSRDQLEEVIRGPIERAGAAIEPALINTLVNDGGDEPDYLPVLQHCLLRMWNRAGAERAAQAGSAAPLGGRTLAVAHYNAIGRIGEALSRHADEILGDLKGHELAVEQMFRALADIDKEGRATRRALKFSQLVAETGVPPNELTRAVDRYRADDCSFLVPPISVAPKLTPDTRVDVGHEALLRGWTRVSGVPDAPQDDEPESIKARGWIRAEERDGINYKGLVARIDEGTLPLRRFDKRLKWWRSRPRTPAWGRRYGGRFDEVERLFDNTIGRRKRYLGYGAASVAATISVVAAGILAAPHAQHYVQHYYVQRYLVQQEQPTKHAEHNYKLVAQAAKLMLDSIHTSLRQGGLPMQSAHELLRTIDVMVEQAKVMNSRPDLTAIEIEMALVVSDIALTLGDRKKAYDKAVFAKGKALALATNKDAAPSVAENAQHRHLRFASDFRVADLAPNLEAALRDYKDGEQVITELVSEFPGSDAYKVNLVFIGNKVAEILQLQGKATEALDYFTAVRKAAEALVTNQPGNPEMQRQLAATRTKICKVMTELKPPDFDGALAECDGAMAIQKRLVAMNLPDFAPTTNLAITHKVKADLLVQQSASDRAQPGDLKLALEEYQESIKIRVHFAERDRSDMRWPELLAQVYEKYGEALEKSGDLPRALEQYQKEADARRVLATARPKDEKLQRDVVASEARVKTKLAATQSTAPETTGSVTPVKR